MQAISPLVIGMFLLSTALQAVSWSLLPMTSGFTKFGPSAIFVLLFTFGVWLMGRVSASGIPLSILIPVTATIVPLITVIVGITIYHEPASLMRLMLLIFACGVIGFASTL